MVAHPLEAETYYECDLMDVSRYPAFVHSLARRAASYPVAKSFILKRLIRPQRSPNVRQRRARLELQEFTELDYCPR